MAAGLEQLDAYGSLDELPWSLDDPVWDLFFPAEIADDCGTFTLEMLDNFGTIDSLPYSLDDPFWQKIICTKFAQGVSWGQANVSSNANASFSASADVSTSAEVDATASRILHDSADIDAQASVSAYANAIFASSGSVSASATVVAFPSVIRHAEGSIYAYADVLAYANAIWSDSASIDASANLASGSVRIRTSGGAVDASASVEADSIRFRTSTADVNAQADVSALGGVIYFGQADVSGVASLTTIANAIFAAHGTINGIASVDANGTRLGDNWVAPVAPTDPVYTTPTTPDSGYIESPDVGGNYTDVVTVFDEWGSVAPAIGERFQGGYYAGEYTLSGKTYFLILADKTNEVRSTPTTGVSNYKLYVSSTDGLSATNWIAFPSTVQTRANKNSIFYKTRQKNISGTTDWYIASQAEWQVVIDNLHSSRTTSDLFKLGGSQALGTSNPSGYWTSSIRPIYTYPSGFSWYIWASEGNGGLYSPPIISTFSTSLFYFRPIRRVLKK